MLVKGTLLGRRAACASSQYVRARVIWQRRESLVVPVVAVQRINGQYFVFVAETGGDAQKGALVARQRPVSLGAIVGNAYVVRSGLAGRPARRHRRRAEAARRRANRGVVTPGRAGLKGAWAHAALELSLSRLCPSMSPMFVDTFIRRPILASVCSLVIVIAGALAIPTLPIAYFPQLAPPQVRSSASTPAPAPKSSRRR